MKSIITLLTLFFFQGLLAKEKPLVGCTHPQVCNILYSIGLGSVTDIQMMKTIGADPHDDQLSTKELKNMMMAKYMFFPPAALQPWITRLAKARSKKTTYVLEYPQNLSNLYPLSTPHQLAHFWLYPEIVCHMTNHLYETLKITFEGLTPYDCKPLFEASKDLFQFLAKELNLVIILTHDALAGHMIKLNKKVFSFRTEGHHSHYGQSENLKIIMSAIKKAKEDKSKVLWVVEDKIKLKSKLKPSSEHYVIHINTLGKINQDPAQVLFDLKDQIISTLKEKK